MDQWTTLCSTELITTISRDISVAAVLVSEGEDGLGVFGALGLVGVCWLARVDAY